MANKDKSIDPVLLKSAREQFLAKGFANASVQEICKNAGVTTGALYTRYKGKEELFEAVVEDAVQVLNDIAKAAETDIEHLSDRDLLAPWYADAAGLSRFFDLFEGVRDSFILLLTCAEGTKYRHFHHDFAQQLTEIDYRYYAEAHRRGLARENISKEALHVLLTAYWELFYEPFIHGMSRDEMTALCQTIAKLIDWKQALGLPESLPD